MRNISGPSRRDYNNPEYAAWRKKVLTRDKFCCQMCGYTKKLNVHHIKRWADFPALRFEISNGIALCNKCHKIVTGKEEYYEPFLYQLLNKSIPLEIFDIMYKKKKPEKNDRKRK